jgi:hypothetical protein
MPKIAGVSVLTVTRTPSWCSCASGCCSSDRQTPSCRSLVGHTRARCGAPPGIPPAPDLRLTARRPRCAPRRVPGWRPTRFPVRLFRRMRGAVQAGRPHAIEPRFEPLWRIALLRPAQSERHHTIVTSIDGDVGMKSPSGISGWSVIVRRGMSKVQRRSMPKSRWTRCRPRVRPSKNVSRGPRYTSGSGVKVISA